MSERTVEELLAVASSEQPVPAWFAPAARRRLAEVDGCLALLRARCAMFGESVHRDCGVVLRYAASKPRSVDSYGRAMLLFSLRHIHNLLVACTRVHPERVDEFLQVACGGNQMLPEGFEPPTSCL